MTRIVFRFNHEKAVEVILYLANRTKDPTFLSLSKLLYFADKTSLEKYGRFITGETYVAMQHGPVPSNAYDLMKAGIDTDAYGFHIQHEHHIIPNRDADLHQLSQSDIVCLDQVIEAYGAFPTWQLRQLSHDEAWEKTWLKARETGSSPIPLEDIIAEIDGGDELLDFMRETHKSNA
jgi:uncharacterized phage-associated protein